MATAAGQRSETGDLAPSRRADAGASNKHAERTARTKRALIAAAVDSLVEQGYARTTTVEICARAGFTRGAYHHHYTELSALFVDVLEALHAEFMDAMPASQGEDASLVEVVEALFSVRDRREFKAVIELWLAARNDPELGKDLAPAIERLSLLFGPSSSGKFMMRLSSDSRAAALFSLAFEASLGLALGRATTPGSAGVGHEDTVVELLLSLAAEHDRANAEKQGSTRKKNSSRR